MKNTSTFYLSAIAFFIANLWAAPDQNNHIYLLFGQSNMAGGGAGVSLGGRGAGTLITADCDTSPRVKVLAFCNCIPCALSGQALNVFSKGGSNFNIPT